MSITEASKKYLDMVKRPKSTSAIGKALKQGGNLSTSPNFMTIVRNALKRDNDFQKVKNEWGLSKWYVGRSLPVEAPVKAKSKHRKSQKQKPKKVAAGEVSNSSKG